MNENLKELYDSRWEQLLNEAGCLRVKAANPLLIKVDKAYIDSDIRIMVVGQETDGWHGCLNEGRKSVSDLMDGYYEYFYQKSKDGKRRNKRSFWNRNNFKYFEEELIRYFKGRSVSFVWNNISKIGNAGRGKPNKEIRLLEKNYFNVLRDEFKVLKPDIVIFTTGMSRDSYIKHHFGNDVQFLPRLCMRDGTLEAETLNLLAEVKLPGFDSVAAIRIEHPNRRTLSNAISLHTIKELFDSKA